MTISVYAKNGRYVGQIGAGRISDGEGLRRARMLLASQDESSGRVEWHEGSRVLGGLNLPALDSSILDDCR